MTPLKSKMKRSKRRTILRIRATIRALIMSIMKSRVRSRSRKREVRNCESKFLQESQLQSSFVQSGVSLRESWVTTVSKRRNEKRRNCKMRKTMKTWSEVTHLHHQLLLLS